MKYLIFVLSLTVSLISCQEEKLVDSIVKKIENQVNKNKS